MSYRPFCSSSVRGWCEPILVGGLTYIGRWYVPILVTTRTYIGQPADQYRLLSRVKQYWSAIGPVLITHSNQYWSRREVVLVTSSTSTGRKTDLVEGCRTDSCERLIIYGRLFLPLHSVSSSRERTNSSLSTKSTRCPRSTWERDSNKEKISL